MPEILNIDAAFGISVSYQFSENWTELADGKEQVVVNWEQPKALFGLSRSIFTQEELDYLLGFFAQQTGEIFLYKDPIDNFCTSYAWEIKPGYFSLGELHPISATEYQLCKTYIVGGQEAVRPITRPKNDLNFNIISTTSYTVDWETGRVIFSAVPSESELTWQGSFYVPVVLQNDNLSHQIESNKDEYSFDQFQLIEFRESNLSFVDNRPQSISIELDLDLIVAQQSTTSKKVSSFLTDSGWFKQEKLWEQPKTVITTARKENASDIDAEAAIALWRVTLGGAIAFKYREDLVHCKSDTLSLSVNSGFTYEIDSLELLKVEGSFLDALDSETYLITLIDSSGSMDNDIPNVEATIAELRPLLAQSVYGGSQAAVDKYFKPIQYIGDERWVEWLSRDYRDNPSEPDKVIIMVWINESDPIYHNSGLDTPPTTTYLNDLALFQAKERESFSAIIYAVEFNSGAFTGFQNHLNHAYEGTNGYSIALKNYGVQIRDSVPANSGTEYYLEDLFANKSQAVNFFCRCWRVETQPEVFVEPDYSLLPIVPLQGDSLPEEYFAFIYGTYESTQQNGIYDRGCGEIGYWRSQISVTGREITVRDDKYSLRTGNSFQLRCGIVPISDADYAAKITTALDSQDVMWEGNGCTTGSASIPFGDNVQITDIIPRDDQLPDPPVQTDAYFLLGQCTGVAYGFRAEYDGGATDITGSVAGRITAVRVFLSDGYYALSVDDELGNTVEPIFLTIGGNNFTLAEVPGGIFNLTAVRLDQQIDICGNLYAQNAPQPEATATVGFTSHDRLIDFDGYTFLPNFGGNPQAREYAEEIDSSSNTKITFILAGEAISEQDLIDGKYRGAKITEWVVDWNNPNNRFKIATGYFGRVSTYHAKDGGFTFQVEMRSLVARLQQKNYFITVKLCPKTFGGQELGGCRKNLFGFIDNLTITSIINSVTFTVDSNRNTDNFYGEITFTSGARTNITKLVDSFDGATKTITLRNSEPSLSIGDTLTALAKCDKSYRACYEQFDNAVNHGGFPHVPGTDKAKRAR